MQPLCRWCSSCRMNPLLQSSYAGVMTWHRRGGAREGRGKEEGVPPPDPLPLSILYTHHMHGALCHLLVDHAARDCSRAEHPNVPAPALAIWPRGRRLGSVYRHMRMLPYPHPCVHAHAPVEHVHAQHVHVSAAGRHARGPLRMRRAGQHACGSGGSGERELGAGRSARAMQHSRSMQASVKRIWR